LYNNKTVVQQQDSCTTTRQLYNNKTVVQQQDSYATNDSYATTKTGNQRQNFIDLALGKSEEKIALKTITLKERLDCRCLLESKNEHSLG